MIVLYITAVVSNSPDGEPRGSDIYICYVTIVVARGKSQDPPTSRCHRTQIWKHFFLRWNQFTAFHHGVGYGRRQILNDRIGRTGTNRTHSNFATARTRPRNGYKLLVT